MHLLVVLQVVVNVEIKTLGKVGGCGEEMQDVSRPAVRRRQANLGIILSKSLANSNLDS